MSRRLRSYSRSLREVFEHSISAKYISENLVSFDAEREALQVQALLERRGFDQVGVRENGVVIGYASRETLNDGTLGQHLRPVSEGDPRLISGEEPLLRTLHAIRESGFVLISMLGGTVGIATAADVQKAPVRMWLFGLISIFEMQMLRLVREAHPNGEWLEHLSDERIEKAREIQALRNNAPDLIECLQLSDKCTIIRKTALRHQLGFVSGSKASQLFREVEDLRNDLAHSQDLSKHWPKFLKIAAELERVIKVAEQIRTRR